MLFRYWYMIIITVNVANKTYAFYTTTRSALLLARLLGASSLYTTVRQLLLCYCAANGALTSAGLESLEDSNVS